MEKTSSNQKRKSAKTLKGNGINFRTQFNPHYNGAEGEKNNGAIHTVPDQSLSILTLLKNHTRGLYSDVHVHDPQYFETEIPVINDLIDAMEYKEDLDERKEQLKQQAIELINEKKKKATPPKKEEKPSEIEENTTKKPAGGPAQDK